MNDSRKDETKADHGYRNEVSWDGGKGRQPYGNRGDAEEKPAALPEVEGGNAREAAVRNAEQLEDVNDAPEKPGSVGIR